MPKRKLIEEKQSVLEEITSLQLFLISDHLFFRGMTTGGTEQGGTDRNKTGPTRAGTATRDSRQVGPNLCFRGVQQQLGRDET